jgi:hypothetical protein
LADKQATVDNWAEMKKAHRPTWAASPLPESAEQPLEAIEPAVSKNVSTVEAEAIGNINNTMQELQRRLRESEERRKEAEDKRRDLLIEYQSKLDNERRRILQLQGKVEQLVRERSDTESALSKTRQLEQQRDALREALLSLRESKDMQIQEMKSLLVQRDISRTRSMMVIPISPVSPNVEHPDEGGRCTPPRHDFSNLGHIRGRSECSPSLSGSPAPSPPVSRSPSASIDLTATSLPGDSPAAKELLKKSSLRIGIRPLLPIADGVTFQ